MPDIVPPRSSAMLSVAALPVGAVGCLVAAFAISMVMSFVLIPLNVALTGPAGAGGSEFGYTLMAGLSELVILGMIGTRAALKKPIGTPASELFAAGWFLGLAVVLCSAVTRFGA